MLSDYKRIAHSIVARSSGIFISDDRYTPRAACSTFLAKWKSITGCSPEMMQSTKFLAAPLNPSIQSIGTSKPVVSPAAV